MTMTYAVVPLWYYICLCLHDYVYVYATIYYYYRSIAHDYVFLRTEFCPIYHCVLAKNLEGGTNPITSHPYDRVIITLFPMTFVSRSTSLKHLLYTTYNDTHDMSSTIFGSVYTVRHWFVTCPTQFRWISYILVYRVPVLLDPSRLRWDRSGGRKRRDWTTHWFHWDG